MPMQKRKSVKRDPRKTDAFTFHSHCNVGEIVMLDCGERGMNPFVILCISILASDPARSPNYLCREIVLDNIDTPDPEVIPEPALIDRLRGIAKWETV